MKDKKEKRIRRHRRVRAKISGTAERPRLSVFRSIKNLEVQAIDDTKKKTIIGLSDRKIKKGTKTERAKALGKLAAEKMTDKKITSVVFDRGGFRYHGRIKAFADSLREGGVSF